MAVLSEADQLSQFEAQRQALWSRGEVIVLSSPRLYVDVDIEADGIAGHGSMLALGAQSATGEPFYSEIRPAFPDFIPDHRAFCESHGLERERLLREAPDMTEVMGRFNDWLTQLQTEYGKTPVFTAYSAGFDWSLVHLYFRKCGIPNPFGYSAFDLKSLALPLTGDWDWGKTGISQLPRIILPDGDFTHHALKDAQYQQKIHFGMAGLLGDRDYHTISGNT